jgi:S1-C subfamily serine protease
MTHTDRLRLASLPCALLTALLFSTPLFARDSASPSGAWLGIAGERIDDAYRERENYWSQGLLVSEVSPGSPADRIGVQKGDIVVSVGSHVLKTPDDLELSESTLAPGRSVSLVVARNGGRWIRILNIEPDQPPGLAAAAANEGALRTEDEPESPEVREASKSAIDSAIPVDSDEDDDAVSVPVPPVSGAPRTEAFGARYQPMNEGLAAALGVADPKGMLVLEVTAGGLADLAGIRAGDVITRVADLEVPDGERLSYALETCPRITAIRTWRQGSVREAKVTFPTRKALLAAARAKSDLAPTSTAAPEKAPASESTPAKDVLTLSLTPPPAAPEAPATPEVDSAPKSESEPLASAPDASNPKLTDAPDTAEPDAAIAPASDSVRDLERMLRDLREEVNQLRGEVKRLRSEMNGLKQI